MKKSLIAAIFCAFMAVYGLYATATGQVESPNGYYAVGLFALLAVFFALKVRKNRKVKPAKAKKAVEKPRATKAAEVPAKAAATAPAKVPVAVATPDAQPTQKPITNKIVYNGKVKGTAMVPERQTALAWLKEQDDNGKSLLFTLEEDEYEGKPSIKVMVEVMLSEEPPRHIGYIAAADVDKVLPYMPKAYVDGHIYGGEDGKNYGAAVDVFIVEE